MPFMSILKQFEDGLVFQWHGPTTQSIWALRPDGDEPSLWPVAILEVTPNGATSIKIPRGTDTANANAVLSSIGLDLRL